jgi:glyoxylase I family protein
MPRLGYPAMWDYAGEFSVGWLSPGGSFWIKQADARYAEETFSKDRVGLCEVAFRAENREQVDALAHDVEQWGGTILDPPREYPDYVPGYYAVFFSDPDGIKLECVHIPG